MSHRKHILGLLAGVTTVLLLVGCSQSPSAPQPLSSDGVPVWNAPATQIEQHAKDAGLEILPKEGTVMHIHTHLSVTYDGRKITVPEHIGIDTQAGAYSELHTHDTSGIIHVEAAHKQTFYLRQFFKEWDVNLGGDSVDAFTAGRHGVQIRMFVNGKRYMHPFTSLALSNKTDVSIAITTDGTTPQPAKQFVWPQGY